MAGALMKQTVIACVGSSLLTVGLLSLAGFGPLNPPPGPVAPTSVSLDQLAAAIAAVQPGGVTLPGTTYTNGGTLIVTRPGQGATTVPLIGYSVERQKASPVGYAPVPVTTASQLLEDLTFVSVAVEGGRYGGIVGSYAGATLTIHGSDGTTIGPFGSNQYTRRLVNGPVAGGNKCIDVVTFYRDSGLGTLPASDPSGTTVFGSVGP